MEKKPGFVLLRGGMSSAEIELPKDEPPVTDAQQLTDAIETLTKAQPKSPMNAIVTLAIVVFLGGGFGLSEIMDGIRQMQEFGPAVVQLEEAVLDLKESNDALKGELELHRHAIDRLSAAPGITVEAGP